MLYLILTDVVWPEVKQSGLIDSVLRNYYIPPIIFGKSTYPRWFTHALIESINSGIDF